jgi:hypothetical protein
VAGTLDAENKMVALLHDNIDAIEDRPSAIKLGLEAWATGKLNARRQLPSLSAATEEDEEIEILSVGEILKEEIGAGKVEVALLERKTARESKFRLLRADELEPVLAEYR